MEAGAMPATLAGYGIVAHMACQGESASARPCIAKPPAFFTGKSAMATAQQD